MKKITIAGLGIVGNAINEYYKNRGVDILVYDPPKGFTDESVLKNTDAVFIAVPTPHTERGFDLRHVDEVMPLIGDGVTVIIKSTVLPGTTDMYQEKYPQLHLLFSPEFLTAKTAVRDFAQPTRQIVGHTEKSKAKAEPVLDFLPDAGHKKIMTARAAEMVKYMNNVFYAMKVTFANQVYDLCEALGIDYDSVAEAAVTNEPWMGSNHWDVFFGGYRGYGGVCLPKDVRSLIQLGKELGIDVTLLERVEQLNNTRVAEHQKLSKDKK